MNVLIVDDEHLARQRLRKMLSAAAGYQIIGEAETGEDALRKTQASHPDVVLMDIRMPGMDGITTLKEIKKLGLFTETLILTGHGAIDTALEATKLGAYDYLTKPCEIDELVAKIEGAWEKKDDAQKEDMQEKIQKVVESPSSAFSLFGKKKSKK